MIITTIQEANLLDCGCCPWSVCEAPQKECEDKTLIWTPCGWNFENFQAAFGQAEDPGWSFDDVPCPDRSRIWQTVTRTLTSTDPEEETTIYTITIVTGTECGIDGIPEDNTENDIALRGAGSLVPIDDYAAGEFTGSLSSGGTDYTVSVVFSDQLNPDVEALGESMSELEWQEDGSCSTLNEIEYAICDEEATDQVVSLELRAKRYRFAPPASFLTEESNRTVYELEWDEIFFPKKWDEWDQGGRVGPEPESRPFLVIRRSWEWGGDKTEDGKWSSWFQNEAPVLAEGQVRTVNLMVTCWKSARAGGKPTAHGEIYVFPEE